MTSTAEEIRNSQKRRSQEIYRQQPMKLSNEVKVGMAVFVAVIIFFAA